MADDGEKNKCLKIADGEDRFSDLSEIPLHHIFSSIDMKCIIMKTTSFRSRKWRNFWTTVNYLNFDENTFHSLGRTNYKDVGSFMNFVDRILFGRKGADIKRFYLQFANFCNLGRVVTWTLVALWSNVEELDLGFPTDEEEVRLPDCIFISKSLRVLRLRILKVDENWDKPRLILPDAIDLPNLRTLHLERLQFVGKSINKLLSSCPMMKSLTVMGCSLGCTENLDVSCLQLNTLVIEACIPEPPDNPNVRYEDISPESECKIRVSAPCVTSLKYTDYLTRDRALENLFAVEEAEINLLLDEEYGMEGEGTPFPEENKNEYAQRMIACLRDVHNAKALTLSGLALKIIAEASDAFDILDAPFCNLKYLKVKTLLLRNSIIGITYIIRRSPNIESLVVEIRKYWKKDDDATSMRTYEVPEQCMLNNLKFVEIVDFFGHRNEVTFLFFLLRNAILLEKLTISISRERRGDRAETLKQFSRRLNSIPRRSTSAKIVLL